MINEKEAKVVQDIFSWVADEGLTLRKIVVRLQELNIQPRKSKFGIWRTSTLSNLLRNKSYIGEARWNSSTSVVAINPTNKERYRKMKKTSKRSKPESEWLIIPVPLIISPELFYRAEKQRLANFELCKRNTKNEYLLAGRIFCECGIRRAGEGPQNGKFLYYRCSNRVYNFPLPPTCIKKSINARCTDKVVWDSIVALMTSPTLLQQQVQRLQNKNEVIQQPDNYSAGLGKEIEKLKKQEERYTQGYAEGLFAIEKLKEYLDQIRKRIAELELKLQQTKDGSRTIKSKFPDYSDIEQLTAIATNTLENLNFQAKRAIVLNVIEKVVASKEQLSIYGNIPLEQNVSFNSIYRNRRSPQRRQIDAF